MITARLSILGVACIVLSTRIASAQSDAGLDAAALVATPAESSGQIALARTEYQAGVDASQAQRWGEALGHFEHAYELSSRLPQILINVAGAQAQLGRLTAAIESYRRFLHASAGLGLDEYRTVAQQQLALLAPRVAHLRVSIVGLGPRDVVSVDDAVLARAALDHDLPVDPGSHRVAVARGERTLGDETVALVDGAARSIALRVPPPPPEARTPVDVDPRVVTRRRANQPVTASPWFWTVVAVVGSAAIVTLVSVLVLSLPEVRPALGVLPEPP